MVQEIEGTCLRVSKYYPGITTKTELDERILRAEKRILSAGRYVSDIIERLSAAFKEYRGYYGGRLYWTVPDTRDNKAAIPSKPID